MSATTQALYAMDTCFINSTGMYPFDVRCEMLRELGYGGLLMMLAWRGWDDIPKLHTMEERHGLRPVGLYVTCDIAADPTSPDHDWFFSLPDRLPRHCLLELGMTCGDGGIAVSSPAGDSLALRWLERLLGRAEATQTTVALYHHAGHWLESVGDCARLCAAMPHPLLRAVFSGLQWYAAGGRDLEGSIAAAAPFLADVNVSGATRGGNYFGCTVLPLDSGEMDNFALLGLLRRHGYAGPVGFNGWSVGGCPAAQLRRSLAAYREMAGLLERSPHWAALHFSSRAA